MFKTDYESKLSKHIIGQGIVMKYEHIDELTKEQFAVARNNGFGASDSAKLLGVSPFGDRMDLIREKAAGTVNEEIGKKASVRKGSDVEHIILEKGEKLISGVLHMDEEESIHIHKPYNMYGLRESALNINYDGVVFKGENVLTIAEAKLVTKYGRKYYDFNKAMLRTIDGDVDINYINEPEKPTHPIVNDINILDVCTKLAEYYGVPVYYYTQVQQQLMSMTEDYGYLIVQDDDNWETYVFKIYKNEQLIEILKQKSVSAWAMVEAMRANANR